MGGGYGPEAFAKVHPKLDYTSTGAKTREARTIVRSYLIRVTDMLR
jgi:hypothetical protein